jgi:hypothetical protein
LEFVSFSQQVFLDNTISFNTMNVLIFPPAGGAPEWDPNNATVISSALQNQDIWFSSIGPMSVYFYGGPYAGPSPDDTPLLSYAIIDSIRLIDRFRHADYSIPSSRPIDSSYGWMDGWMGRLIEFSMLIN